MKQSTKNALLILLGGLFALAGQGVGTMIPDGLQRPGIEASLTEQLSDVPGRLQLVETYSSWTGGNYSLWLDSASGKVIAQFEGSAIVLPSPEMPDILGDIQKP